MRRIKLSRHTGFTLIELMFVVVIISILLIVGIPSFKILKNNNCLVTNTNRLVASLQYARSEAAKRNADVSLKPRAGSWRNGFLVATNELDFDGDGKCNANTIEDIDGSGDDTCTADATMKIIELGCGDVDTSIGLQIVKINAVDVEETTDFTYRSSGRLTTLSNNRQFGICMSNYTGDDRGRVVTVSNIGRPSTKRANIANCPMDGSDFP